MPHTLKVIACQAHSCTNKIVLPYSSSALPGQSRAVFATGAPYLDVACSQCRQVFRYTPEMGRQRVDDTPDPYQPPAQAVWFRVWLKCDSKGCASHVVSESAMASGATAKDINAFITSWFPADAVKCCSEHQAKQPLEIVWAAILFPILRTIHPYEAVRSLPQLPGGRP